MNPAPTPDLQMFEFTGRMILPQAVVRIQADSREAAEDVARAQMFDSVIAAGHMLFEWDEQRPTHIETATDRGPK